MQTFQGKNNNMSLHPALTKFRGIKYRHMLNIPGNRVFVTDQTCSTLVWYEGNVVIEYYMIFPNVETPLHHHPFDNQIIFLNGELTGIRRDPETGIITETTAYDRDSNTVGSMCPAGHEHAFKSGPMGATFYNFQFWPEDVPNPLSAAIQWNGPPMGPVHDQAMKLLKTI
jgi:hypothetical protein